MQFVPYIRWSSDKQSRGSSLGRQTDTITAYAAEKGWPLPAPTEWLRDEGVSAYKGHNLDATGALGKFTNEVCRTGGHDITLIVEQLDRLSRKSSGDVLEWFFRVTNAGLTVVLCDNRMIVDRNSIRNQTDQIRALLDDADRSNSESDRKSTLLRKAWDSIRNGMEAKTDRGGVIEKIERHSTRHNPADFGIDITIKTKRGTEIIELSTLAEGFSPSVGDFVEPKQVLGWIVRKVHTSGTCPAWLELSACRRFFTPIQERVAVLESIFAAYAEGKSNNAIVRMLNGDRVPTFRGGECWRASSVKALIESRSVIGEYQHMSRAAGQTIGDPDPTYFPQVISNSLFQAANAPRSGHKREGRGRSILVRNLLADVARCASCGAKMYFIRKTRQGRPDDAYMQCASYFLNRHNEGGKTCRAKMNWRYRPILETLLDRLLTVALDDQHFTNDAEISALGSRAADQRRIIEGLGAQLDNLAANMEGSASPRLRARFDDLEAQEAAEKEKLAGIERELVIARGAVDPAVHIKRVAAIRADMDDEGDDGLKARTTMKNALNGLIGHMLFDPDTGFVNIQLVASARYLSIHSSGEMGADINLHGREPTDAEKPFLDAYRRRLEAA